MANSIRLRRGTFANIPVLNDGEAGWCTDNFKLFIGQGGTNRLVGEADFLKLAGGSLTNFLTLHANPSSDMHAATKQYVDSLVMGFDFKGSCRVATTGSITLSGTQSIDSVSVLAGDRVLVKDQASTLTNGIYVCAAGAWSRATDADTSAEVTPGMFVFIEEGTVNGDKSFLLTTNGPIVLDTTGLTFSLFPAVSGSSFLSLTDTPSSYSGEGSKIVRVNSGATALEFVGFAATYLETNPSSGETNKAPTSSWAFTHTGASTGVHGAGGDTLLHSGSTIDGGAFV